MSEYLIDGILLTRDHPMYKEMLASAYAKKSRPLCMCKSEGVPMYIAKLGAKEFLVKRMPNSGNQHHIDCESYEIPAELSGRGELDEKAVLEDQETGLTSLKLDFSLSKRSSSRSADMTASGEPSTASANPKKLSILSLLHLLYDEAGLSRWSPRMAGKRNWYVVRKHLLNAAANKVSRSHQLSEFLLIPEVFSVENKDAIEARRKQFMHKLKPQAGKQPMGLLIGELKSIESARFGHKLIIKHMPGHPFYLTEQLHKRINKVFSAELSHFYESESIHLIVIATFLISSSGNPIIDTISCMTVDSNWLPFEDINHLELVERLTTEQRHFIKGLRYNLKKTEVIASCLLTDADQPTAIYIQPDQDDDNYIESMNTVIKSSELNSVIWRIDSGESLKLPMPIENKRTNNHANS